MTHSLRENYLMSGGYPDDIVAAMANASISVGTSNGESLLPLTCNPNGIATKNSVMWGTKGSNGALRYSEFKLKLAKIFHYNLEVGSIFVASYNSKAAVEFFDELYLSYLLFFKENPCNFRTPQSLHESLFESQNQYAYFKHFIVFPNLNYNGIYGFPENIGAKEIVAKHWLKFYN
jgi:hypothetical protein